MKVNHFFKITLVLMALLTFSFQLEAILFNPVKLEKRLSTSIEFDKPIYVYFKFSSPSILTFSENLKSEEIKLSIQYDYDYENLITNQQSWEYSTMMSYEKKENQIFLDGIKNKENIVLIKISLIEKESRNIEIQYEEIEKFPENSTIETNLVSDKEKFYVFNQVETSIINQYLYLYISEKPKKSLDKPDSRQVKILKIPIIQKIQIKIYYSSIFQENNIIQADFNSLQRILFDYKSILESKNLIISIKSYSTSPSLYSISLYNDNIKRINIQNSQSKRKSISVMINNDFLNKDTLLFLSPTIFDLSPFEEKVSVDFGFVVLERKSDSIRKKIGMKENNNFKSNLHSIYSSIPINIRENTDLIVGSVNKNPDILKDLLFSFYYTNTYTYNDNDNYNESKEMSFMNEVIVSPIYEISQDKEIIVSNINESFIIKLLDASAKLKINYEFNKERPFIICSKILQGINANVKINDKEYINSFIEIIIDSQDSFNTYSSINIKSDQSNIFVVISFKEVLPQSKYEILQADKKNTYSLSTYYAISLPQISNSIGKNSLTNVYSNIYSLFLEFSHSYISFKYSFSEEFNVNNSKYLLFNKENLLEDENIVINSKSLSINQMLIKPSKKLYLIIKFISMDYKEKSSFKFNLQNASVYDNEISDYGLKYKSATSLMIVNLNSYKSKFILNMNNYKCLFGDSLNSLKFLPMSYSTLTSNTLFLICSTNEVYLPIKDIQISNFSINENNLIPKKFKIKSSKLGCNIESLINTIDPTKDNKELKIYVLFNLSSIKNEAQSNEEEKEKSENSGDLFEKFIKLDKKERIDYLISNKNDNNISIKSFTYDMSEGLISILYILYDSSSENYLSLNSIDSFSILIDNRGYKNDFVFYILFVITAVSLVLIISYFIARKYCLKEFLFNFEIVDYDQVDEKEREKEKNREIKIGN